MAGGWRMQSDASTVYCHTRYEPWKRQESWSTQQQQQQHLTCETWNEASESL